MPESTFNRLAIEASVYIRSNTFGRIDMADIPEDVKFCMCSVADKKLKLESKQGKKSETVGNWRVDYVESAEDKEDLYNILRNYLSPDLLNRRC
ncbi:hypothetical protein D3C71_1720250 [compost metagenome]